MQLIGLTTTEVKQQTITEEVQANGVVAYDRRLAARISSRVDGTIWRVEKHLGDSVCKGDVLAVIQSVAIGDAKAEFLKALAVAESRTEQRKRLDNLTDVVSQTELREAILAERESLVQLHNAQQTLVNFGLPASYLDFLQLNDQERFERLHFLGLPESLVGPLDSRRISSNLAPLTAPFDGQVISRDAGLGEVVQTEDDLFEIADSSRMWLLLDVRKEDAGQLALGQPLEFTADGLERTIRAEIDWISTEVDEDTRTLRIRATVDNPLAAEGTETGNQRLLRANTFGVANIRVREHEQALVVPKDCVQWDQEGHIVFVQSGERRFRMIRVNCGIATDDVVEIEGDVAPGAAIVQHGGHLLKSEVLLARFASAASD